MTAITAADMARRSNAAQRARGDEHYREIRRRAARASNAAQRANLGEAAYRESRRRAGRIAAAGITPEQRAERGRTQRATWEAKKVGAGAKKAAKRPPRGLDR